MKNKTLSFILASALTLGSAFSLSGCDGSNQVNGEVTPYPITVGNVTVQKSPRAVASLSPALTHMLIDLGYQDRIVGYSSDDTIPEGVILSDLTEQLAAAQEAAAAASDTVTSDGEGDAVASDSSAEASSAGDEEASAGESSSEEPSSQETPSGESSDPLMTSSLAAFLESWDGESPIPREPVYYGQIGTAMSPDLLTIGILKPEILFTTLPLTRAQMDKLDDVNIKVVVLPAVTSLDGLSERYLDLIRLMDGQLAADSDGKALVDEMQRQLDYIAAQTPEASKSFLYVCSLDPLIATGDTWESSVLSLLGKNLAADQSGYAVSAEELAAMDPDVIFYADPLLPEHFSGSELFQNKKAVTGNSLVKLDAAALMSQTRNIIESVCSLAETLYPDVDFTIPPPSSNTDGTESTDGGSAPSDDSMASE